MAEEKKKKKNFKDVTGIKFADLIMPMILGGVGSYSRPAGRGVEIGLQAFRTLQAGKEYSDEREMKKKVSDYFGTRVEEMEEEAKMLAQDKQSMDDTSRYGFYGNAGMTMPDPNRNIAEGLVENQKYSDLINPKKKMSMFSDGNIEGDEGPQGSQLIGEMEQPLPVPDMQALIDALVNKKERQDGLVRDMKIADGRKHFFEMAQLGALSNPGAATYMGMQEQASRMSTVDDITKTLATAKMWSDNNKQKAQITAYQTELNAATKYGYQEKLLRLKKELDGQFKPMGMTSKGFVKWDNEKQDAIFVDFPEERGFEALASLPFDDRFNLMDKAARTYNMFKKRGTETGNDAADKMIMNTEKRIIANLWATMQSTEDITSLMQKLNEKNQELQVAGLPPITLEQYLKSIGLEYGLNDEPLGGGETGGKNKFLLNPEGDNG